ncbi:MAG: DNA mismatch repair endonuclease MutL [Flavobacteriales bacterium]|nr:DNA mismatch repair endonuclease MutL [Flavobacteriales bacterium]
MPDIIQLLPDFVANQIAAGEVIQRPASVVKELLENAIDAEATTIQLILKDAGRTLVQIIDDGKGMSMPDARMCFERHATSKISSADDLWKIKTKGFRGEALASIASVAQVEMKTKQASSELGTCIKIEGSTVNECEPCQTADGTSFAIRNLFFNVPARRQFLKTDAVETKHIMDEFQRVALAHPEVTMSMHHNGNEVYHLPKGSFRQRAVGIFGQKYDERLVPVEEETDLVRISGFIGKPEFARKTRGEQFFFVNDRFIKHHYLHHAVSGALEGLLQNAQHPFYLLYLDVDPSMVDVNIHPTKTEVKFKEERAIYSILKSAIRKSLGQFQVAPTLDFEQETSLNIAPFDGKTPVSIPQITVDPNYNPFDTTTHKEPRRAERVPGAIERSKGGGDWKEMYEIMRTPDTSSQELDLGETTDRPQSFEADAPEKAVVFQVGKRFLLTPIKSGMILIDQQRAHERILYEDFLAKGADHHGSSQQLLFPFTLSLTPADHALLVEESKALQQMGFDIEDFGGSDFVVRGLPADCRQQNPQKLVDAILNQLHNGESTADHPERHLLALGLAKGSSIGKGQTLQQVEMRDLIDRLFACEVPYYSPGGKSVIVTITPEELSGKFD